MTSPLADTRVSLETLAISVVEKALRHGATAAECTISEGDEFSASVRMGEIEKLTEAGSRGAGVRVLIGLRAGSSYTSDLSPDGIEQMVNAAVALAKITSEDPFNGLPDPGDLGKLDTDLGLFSEDIERLDPKWKIEQAIAAERAALAADPRISNSEGASFDSYLGRRAFANSHGFSGSYRSSSCSLSVVPVAKSGDSMERDWWYTSGRSAARLEPAEQVGRIAAERALRRLNPRKVATQTASVIFEPRTARSMVGHIFDAASGSSVYRQASFLAGKLGETVAAPGITVIDDGTIPGLFGSSPFDDEGVISRRTAVIRDGVLNSYLLNTYTARKLNLRTTGNASRGITGNAGVGHGNLFLEAGPASPHDLIRSVEKGIYVTEMIGSGVSTVTGDYSRGAVGIWIENGELTFPVSEITIAGNLRDMLRQIEVANDLEFRGSVASPTILIREMTISGQ